MVKKSLPRSLSIVVEPSHRLITDSTDRVASGGLTLDAPVQNLESPRNTSFGVSSPPLAASNYELRTSPPPNLRSSPRSHLELSPPPPSATRPTFNLPRSHSLAAPSPSPTPDLPQLKLNLPPSASSSFAASLAARRRSSAASLPSLPAPPPRSRKASITSLASITGGGRAAEDGFGYTHATASNAALSSINMPAPYKNGPIQVLPGIWLGCEDNARDWEALKRCNIGSVLNVAKEIKDLFAGSDASPPPRVRSSVSTPNFLTKAPKLRIPLRPAVVIPSATLYPADEESGRPELYYLHLPWSHGQSDLVANGFPQAMAFTDEALARGKGILIHCQCGISRSATLVIALVMRAARQSDATDELRALGPTMHASYDFVKQKSVCVGPNMSLIYQLLEYERHLHQPTHLTLSRTSSFANPNVHSEPSDLSSSEYENSPIEGGILSEEERIKSEEEEWARMRRQMEEEEEREREESFRLAGARGPGPVVWPSHSNTTAELRDEARDLDRAMEERVVLRRKSSVASGGGGGGLTSLGAWKARVLGGRRSRTQSAASTGTARSVSMISVEEEGSMDMEVQLGSGSNSDVEGSPRMTLTTPLSANTNSTADGGSAPITPLSLPFKGKHGLGLKSVGREMDLSDVQIVVQEATPMAHRLGAYDFNSSTAMNLDSPLSPSLASGFPSLPTARPVFSPRSNNMTPPPPSASHLKTSFDHSPPPPPAATLRKPNSMSKLAASRRSSRASRLEPVPSSPVSSSMTTTMSSSIGVHSIDTIVGRPSQRRRFSRSSSTSSRRSMSPDVPNTYDMQETTTTTSKPKLIPSPLTLTQNDHHPSYVLSGSLTTESSNRTSSTASSTSSSSSHSSSSAAKRFRQRLLSRTKPVVTPESGPSTITPHQTLFIFPPSPTQNTTNTNVAPSMTPSALMLTTDRTSLLTPTPTLATFRRGGAPFAEVDRRNRSRKSSASSSASSRSSGGAWLGVVPSTPTTACSRVDAKGWVGR